MSRFPTPLHPIREALKGLVRKEPPDFVTGHDLKGLTDQQLLDLQDWCSLNVRPQWATGLSVIEAAELLVESAIQNGNILSAEKVAEDPPPDLERCQAFMLPNNPESRCTGSSLVIVEETGSDALPGRRSLCRICHKVFKEVYGVRGYRFTPISKLKNRPRKRGSSRGTRIDGSTRIGE